MKDHPMLFSGPMVQALIDGRKTQTRRVLRPQPRSAPICHDGVWTDCEGLKDGPYDIPLRNDVKPIPIKVKAGDRIWVRESFARISVSPILETIDNPMPVYRVCDNRTDYGGPWKPSIHMPRAISRVTLYVTDVKVERLQNISNADCISEGIECVNTVDDVPIWKNYLGKGSLLSTGGLLTPSASFRSLWGSINGPDQWAENPWVLAYSFQVKTENIDA